jgi:S-adenosylmethionine:tRNA ribosyltransferase-isomerase
VEHFELEDFDYDLPKEKIALYPAVERDHSKLLLFDKERKIKHLLFYQIPELIPSGSLLVRNISKVIPARLFFQKPTGGRVEIFLLEPVLPSPDPQIALSSKNVCTWKTLLRGRNLKAGLELFPLNSQMHEGNLVAKIQEKNPEGTLVEFRWSEDIDFATLITSLGRIPLPHTSPEPTRISTKSATKRFIASSRLGCLPHSRTSFYPKCSRKLKANSVDFADISLHIGLGTFKPIETKNIFEHKMHSEQFHIELTTLKKILYFFKNRTPQQICLAVGTTSVRTLESIYWLVQKIVTQKDKTLTLPINIEQFIWRNYSPLLNPAESLEFLIETLEKQQISSIYGSTQLFITPGYRIKFFDALITNFHLPRSTLLLLIYSFVGKEWKRIYTEALNNNYRFLSYGDSSLLFKVVE